MYGEAGDSKEGRKYEKKSSIGRKEGRKKGMKEERKTRKKERKKKRRRIKKVGKIVRK